MGRGGRADARTASWLQSMLSKPGWMRLHKKHMLHCWWVASELRLGQLLPHVFSSPMLRRPALLVNE